MIYALLFTLTTAYAAILSTPPGRQFADKKTAESVIIGVSLVLAVLRLLLPAAAWGRVVGAFVVAGLPLVARSLVGRLSEPVGIID